VNAFIVVGFNLLNTDLNETFAHLSNRKSATELNSTFETTAVLSSYHYWAKFIWVRHCSSTTFGIGLSL